MKLTYMKFMMFVLIAGLLSACGGSPVEAPVATSAPTEQVSPTPEVPTETAVSTDTAAPTEPAAATDAPVTQPAAEGATVSFANDVLPIIESRCINCHGGDRTEEGLNLTSHANILAGSDNGPVVIPGDAANSLFVEMVATQKMPKRGPKLTPAQIQVFTDWVNEGAPDN